MPRRWVPSKLPFWAVGTYPGLNCPDLFRGQVYGVARMSRQHVGNSLLCISVSPSISRRYQSSPMMDGVP